MPRLNSSYQAQALRVAPASSARLDTYAGHGPFASELAAVEKQGTKNKGVLIVKFVFGLFISYQIGLWLVNLVISKAYTAAL